MSLSNTRKIVIEAKYEATKTVDWVLIHEKGSKLCIWKI